MLLSGVFGFQLHGTDIIQNSLQEKKKVRLSLLCNPFETADGLQSV